MILKTVRLGKKKNCTFSSNEAKCKLCEFLDFCAIGIVCRHENLETKYLGAKIDINLVRSSGLTLDRSIQKENNKEFVHTFLSGFLVNNRLLISQKKKKSIGKNGIFALRPVITDNPSCFLMTTSGTSGKICKKVQYVQYTI